MGFNYFKMIETKYSSQISFEKPIIIRLDGKDVTKNPNINILDTNKDEFADSLKNTASYLSLKYNCIALSSTDEISLIFLNTEIFKNKFKSNKCQKSSSIIAQEVFQIFNSYYRKNTIFFDARTFNIPKDKIKSYIKYRVVSAHNVNITYLSKKIFPYKIRRNKKLTELKKMLQNTSFKELSNSKYINEGFIFYNGKELNYIDIITKKYTQSKNSKIDDI